MSETRELQPALVSDGTTQVGEVRARWAWAEPVIWTDRMLVTLEQGVQGGKWFSLCDKAFSLRSLRAAFTKVKSNGGSKGVDGVTITRFEAALEGNLARLHRELMEGVYQPQAVRRVWIPKPGVRERRPLGIPTVRDRVVQTAIKACLEPIFEKEFEDGSFGFRPGRSCHKALSRVYRGLRGGRHLVVDADIRKFFDTIPHEIIMRGLESRVSDGKLLTVLRRYLRQDVLDEQTWETALQGTPQGSVISPLLANIALHGLDVLAKEGGFELIRYADDFVILCQTTEAAQFALETVSAWLSSQGLSLHPEKTRIVDYAAGESFDFLGFTFEGGRFFPRKKSVQNLRNSVRAKTKRTSGSSLSAIIQDLNRTLLGWFGYFKPCPAGRFVEHDKFVRRRLRAILDVRIGKKPAHRGATNQRWPNAYFESAGLVSMASAKRQATRPL